MDYEKLKDVVSKIKGTTFASMDTVTNVALKGGKKNPFQGRVSKMTSNTQVILFSNHEQNGYQNMVRRRLEKEGKNPEDFTVGKLSWGHRVGNTPFIEHNGKYYIQVILNRGGESEYLLDGKPVDENQIDGLPETKDDNKNQLLEEENRVIVKAYALDSIKSIRVMGEVLEHQPKARTEGGE